MRTPRRGLRFTLHDAGAWFKPHTPHKVQKTREKRMVYSPDGIR
jgi:hypothetical protein